MYSRISFSRTPFSRVEQLNSVVDIICILSTVIEDRLIAKEIIDVNVEMHVFVAEGYKYAENIEIQYLSDTFIADQQNHHENIEARAPPEISFITEQEHHENNNINCFIDTLVIINPEFIEIDVFVDTIIEDNFIAKEDILVNIPIQITESHIQNYHYKEILDINVPIEVIVIVRSMTPIIKYHCIKGKIDDAFYIKGKIDNIFYIKGKADVVFYIKSNGQEGCNV